LRGLLTYIESTPPKVGGKDCNAPVDPELLDREVRRKRRVTANNTFSMVRSALNMAWAEGKAKNDDAWRRVKRFRAVDRARPDYLTLDECKRVLKVSSPELRRIVLAALYTGGRITELMELRAKDLNRQRMAIYIRPLKVYRARHVALPVEGYAFFEELAAGKGAMDRLLQRDNGTRWIATNYPAVLIKRAYKAAGLPATYVFHSLRHTYATLLMQAGTPVVVVARQLGHANILSVVRTYAHCVDDFFDEELRKRFKPGLRGNFDIALKAAMAVSAN